MARLKPHIFGKRKYVTFKDGKRTIETRTEELTTREIKAYIKKVNNWTDDEYRKNYDIFKNKLRAYESFQQAQGRKDVKVQSVAEVLYKQARAKQREGEDYSPSLEMQRIESFSAVSITKGRQLTKNDSYIKRREETYKQYTEKQFEGFLQKNDGAKALKEKLEQAGSTPVQIERALSEYANKNYAKRDKKGKYTQTSPARANGETYGSDKAETIDITPYLPSNK